MLVCFIIFFWDPAVLVLNMNTLAEVRNRESPFQDLENTVTQPARSHYDQLSFPANFLK